MDKVRVVVVVEPMRPARVASVAVSYEAMSWVRDGYDAGEASSVQFFRVARVASSAARFPHAADASEVARFRYALYASRPSTPESIR